MPLRDSNVGSLYVSVWQKCLFFNLSLFLMYLHGHLKTTRSFVKRCGRRARHCCLLAAQYVKRKVVDIKKNRYLLDCTKIGSKFSWILTSITSTNVLPVLPYFAQPCWLTIPWGNISSCNLLPLGNKRLGTYYHFERTFVYRTTCVTWTETVHEVVYRVDGIASWQTLKNNILF